MRHVSTAHRTSRAWAARLSFALAVPIIAQPGRRWTAEFTWHRMSSPDGLGQAPSGPRRTHVRAGQCATVPRWRSSGIAQVSTAHRLAKAQKGSYLSQYRTAHSKGASGMLPVALRKSKPKAFVTKPEGNCRIGHVTCQRQISQSARHLVCN